MPALRLPLEARADSAMVCLCAHGGSQETSPIDPHVGEHARGGEKGEGGVGRSPFYLSETAYSVASYSRLSPVRW